jgi:Flp pilus assembly pilin Flp
MSPSDRVARCAGRARHSLARLWWDQDGLTATEYALLIAMLSLTAAVAFGNLGTQVDETAREGSETLKTAFGSGCMEE